ncbi:lipocalin family protein [Echinicola sp. CAU 1574]|uniref:Lipocalin family protein n=1 Tax=Echinicola arenosa TaxID=2774144 RepID=A0ABR9ALP3_9BACT|nr:lipocalin family protein [Echinicola arenosa]MBD8489667.1 lipocalin family protein [Echinicola arenosa]
MRKLILFGLLIFMGKMTLAQRIEPAKLKGEWKLVQADMVDQVRSSLAYRQAMGEQREAMEYKIKRLLENTFYHFQDGDSLHYTDLKEGAIVQQHANFTLDQDTLLIKKSSKIKKAKIVELTAARLVIVPIVEGKETMGKMVFEKVRP